MLAGIKTLTKYLLSSWLYRYPAPQLRADRLYLYLHTLHETRDVPGAVVEIGCFQGSTATYAHRFLQAINCKREYVCVDTFGGFPQSQFAEDLKLGTEASLRPAFSANSKSLVRKLLNQWGCGSIGLLQADVVLFDESVLPEKIAVALIDVDLAVPTTAALKKIMPRMTPGGMILIDDCDLDGFKGAGIAVGQFAPKAQYRFGMGIISVPLLREKSA